MPENIQAEIKEEIKEFNKLINKYPHIAELYIGRAVLYAKIGEYEKAVKDYETAHEDHIYDIIAVCMRHNLSGEIERLYTQKVNKDKNNVVNYISRARFYRTMGENKKALADCESILEISPNNKLILEMKKAIIKELKEEDKPSKQMQSPKILLT
ncbi:MAG: hypothetical protein J5594_02220 [Elusimicrobiaceae bacterium]|nr:hypothetical protein [Elusimicrobiaceae bacterium]